ncbi:4-hydroxyproline epimerase [Oceanospirillum multiglobuliferum]|uniref:Hydroxyproline-2-epimerase n=1 Tax=Oceanospirillum multiglobuliferum TaxID=64969 RepID=A0A1T4MM23_9GAMM|nr:proline racemase family protein [Oceanospirillum multiglobuliferum]OPX56969.1 hydroxyproline-2-epimerase [Oceanospirillum multiglobuliferum]SJZ67931.1 4-hydroxyproline epimerase [Oceanospirillum multiglobuliferum]
MHVVDSHTEGEPTRVILSGGPDLGSGSLAERAKRLATEHQDLYRSLVKEPYGQEAMVGALLVEPVDQTCVAGVIYFDAAAVIGMCGHGTIGVAATLAHIGKIGVGIHKLETPVGVVEIELTDSNTVSVTNVDSYRLEKNRTIQVEGIGQNGASIEVKGDIAWGGNWFFIVNESPTAVRPDNLMALTQTAMAIRKTLEKEGIAGGEGGIIDHIVLFGDALTAEGHSRNFVLCPDNTYDRSPCGTGCSARLACLAADDLLPPGQEILQESVIGSSYRIRYQPASEGKISPTITGQAFVTRDATLIFNEQDPLRNGINLGV